MPTTKQGEPLQRTITKCAQKMGVSDHFAANLVAYFLEYTADEVTRGEIVRIPGFGIFAPYGYTPRKKGLEKHCLPSFNGSRAFRNQLRAACPYRRHRNKEIDTYRRTNHGSSKAKSHTSRTSSAMHSFRQHIDAQARKFGIKSRPTGILSA
jgi:nucleoid DNA-binding protein